jgi:hypothetical protein
MKMQQNVFSNIWRGGQFCRVSVLFSIEMPKNKNTKIQILKVILRYNFKISLVCFPHQSLGFFFILRDTVAVKTIPTTKYFFSFNSFW